jgi:hypothetical protein
MEHLHDRHPPSSHQDTQRPPAKYIRTNDSGEFTSPFKVLQTVCQLTGALPASSADGAPVQQCVETQQQQQHHHHQQQHDGPKRKLSKKEKKMADPQKAKVTGMRASSSCLFVHKFVELVYLIQFT